MEVAFSTTRQIVMFRTKRFKMAKFIDEQRRENLKCYPEKPIVR